MFWIVPKIQERGEANSSGSGVLNSGLTTSYLCDNIFNISVLWFTWLENADDNKASRAVAQCWEIKHLITVDIVK